MHAQAHAFTDIYPPEQRELYSKTLSESLKSLENMSHAAGLFFFGFPSMEGHFLELQRRLSPSTSMHAPEMAVNYI